MLLVCEEHQHQLEVYNGLVNSVKADWKVHYGCFNEEQPLSLAKDQFYFNSKILWGSSYATAI